jgi:hypothetical protein
MSKRLENFSRGDIVKVLRYPTGDNKSSIGQKALVVAVGPYYVRVYFSNSVYNRVHQLTGSNFIPSMYLPSELEIIG